MSQLNLKNLNKSIFMIRRRSDNKYSSGGSYPRFTKYGKAWTDLGHLKNHLNLVVDSVYEHRTSHGYEGEPFDLLQSLDVYNGCDIVEYKVLLSEDVTLGMDRMKPIIFDSYKEHHAWRFK